MRGLGLNSEKSIGSKFRYQLVDRYEGWTAVEKLTLKGGFRDDPMTAESSVSGAFAMLTRATGVVASALNEGFVIYNR